MSPDLKLFVSQDIEGFGQVVAIMGADDSLAECFLVHLPIDSDEVRCVSSRSYRLDEAEDAADIVETELVAEPLLSLIHNDPWVREHLPDIKLTFREISDGFEQLREAALHAFSTGAGKAVLENIETMCNRTRTLEFKRYLYRLLEHAERARGLRATHLRLRLEVELLPALGEPRSRQYALNTSFVLC